MGYLPGIVFTILIGLITGKVVVYKLGVPVESISNMAGAFGYLVTVVITGYISRMHYKLKYTQKRLKIEHEKIELLISNLLPASIAERFKKGDTLIADRYTDSTIFSRPLA